MSVRMSWWKSSRSRRSQSRVRALITEVLESRVVLFAGIELPVDGLSGGDAAFASSAASVAEHLDHHAAEGEIYLPPQHRLSGTGSLLTAPTGGDPLQIANSYLNGHAADLGLDADDLNNFFVTSQYTDEHSGTTHIYLRQTFDGLEIMNADVSISLTAAGEVIHVASSFVGNAQVAISDTRQVFVNASQAFMGLSDDLELGVQSTPQVVRVDADSVDGGTVLSVAGVGLENVAARLVYVPTAKGLELAWQLDLHTSDYSHWFDAFVEADSGESIYMNDRIGHATYTVFALPARSPIDGTRSTVVDPHDATASPFGWHDTNGMAGAEFTDTRGNNASAQEDVNADNAGGLRPSGGASLAFNFPLDTAQDPNKFQSAAITNAFYWVNLLHDIHYQYGFTEVSGNFQVNNYGRGGTGNDPVLIDVQDGAAVGGGGFAALPDGQSPRMTLQRWSGPFRDGALDSDILIHEFGHGISERLTGGPGNTTALNAIQSKAMGEGWGDWWALMLTQISSDAKLDAYPIGNYISAAPANGPGIRQYPYSFDKTINPLTYHSFNGGSVNNESHKAGAIWASALWDMNWVLIEKHGFSSDFMNGNGGNNVALQLVMDGLKLQGTNPSFLAGRDAILAADVALTGGQNQTEIWIAFARRGMGFSASDGGGAGSIMVTEAFDVPSRITGTVFRDDDASGAQDAPEPGLAGWSVYIDQNNNGMADVATTAIFNSTDTPKAIPDGPKTLFTRAVAGLPGVITDINVTVNLTHAFVGELYLTLISPGNTPVILANYLGGSGDNYTNTVFDDEAANWISTGAAPFTGSFKPYFDLAQLDGRDPNGTWTLRLDDSVAGNTGTLLNWSLEISCGDPDPIAVTDANGNYSFFGLGNGTHHIRSDVSPGFTQTAPANGVHNVVISDGQPVSGRDFGKRAAATVANSTTLEDTLSNAVAIAPTSDQGITHFRISSISGGTLFKNDGTTPIGEGTFVTVSEGQAGVKFLPSVNSTAAGRFDVELSQDGVAVLANTSKASSLITVTAVNDPPVSVSFVNPLTALPVTADTSVALTLAEIIVTDVDSGANLITLSGSDAGLFEIVGMQLRLKAGVVLNPDSKFRYSVIVNVDDVSVGTTPDASAEFQFVVTRLVPTIIAPAATTVELRPGMMWTNSFDEDGAAVGYDVWVSNQSANVPEFHRRTVPGNSWTPDVNLGIGRFGLWVRSIFAGGSTSDWTPRRDFQVYAKVTTLPLAAQQATVKPTLQWNPLTGAVRYDIWISNLTTGQSQFIRDQNISGTSWTPATEMPLGRYRAWVRGIDAAGISAQWSTAVDFTVMPAPIARSPLFPTFDRRPAFSWSAVMGAVSYEVSLRNQTTGAYVSQQKNIATVSWTPPVDLPDGPYRWWVQATGAHGILSFWSPPVDFHVGGRSKLLTPVGGTQQIAPTFTWQLVDGAVRYDLWVDRIGGPTQVIRQTNLIGTQYIPTPVLAAGYYRAWIRAISGSGELSVWSTRIEFKVTTVTLPRFIQPESLARLVTCGALEVFDQSLPDESDKGLDDRKPLIQSVLASFRHMQVRGELNQTTNSGSAERDSERQAPEQHETRLIPEFRTTPEADLMLYDLVMMTIGTDGIPCTISVGTE